MSDSASVSPDSREVETISRAAVEKALGHKGWLTYTPPLPRSWPPSGDGRVLIFAYTTQPASTGLIQSIIFSPTARVELQVGPEGCRIVKRELLEARRLPKLQPQPAGTIGADEMRSGSDALLRAVGSLQPREEDLDAIRRSYARWARQNAVLAGALGDQVSGFLEWLAK